ncbi:hypothetical protein H7F51_04415 [Novosphingobium flavum]|uniref:DUF883 domain-containing protein n=1 Tax=Novosphingobium flavum TaxID=1778672 RepID=A0A7X1FPW7_9SPHN|nr:hypothetical protein [Novosphingobium flavum]MBC2664758.1 hypothetical protein [Novosphingobium flavum]
MAESTATPAKPKAARKPRATKAAAGNAGSTAVAKPSKAANTEAKAKFAKAIEEAKAGTQLLGQQVQDTAGSYREKLTDKSEALLGDAKAMSGQAKEKAAALAVEGKAKAVEGLSAVSKLVADNAVTLDEKLGPKAGDYARTAARSMQDAADKLEAKDLAELGEDARDMVRKSPGLAIGIAAAAGFFFARLFKGSDKSEG